MTSLGDGDSQIPDPTGRLSRPSGSLIHGAWPTASDVSDDVRRLEVEVSRARTEHHLGHYRAVVARLEPLVRQGLAPVEVRGRRPAATGSAMVMLGRAYAALGRTTDSARALERGIAILRDADDRDGPDWSDYGVALYLTGQVHEAVPALEEALRLGVSPPTDAVRHLGLALMTERRYDQAADLLRQAVASAPEDPVVQTALADSLSEQGRTDEAAVVLRDATIALISSNRFEDAQAMAERSLGLRPDDPMTLMIHGEILRVLADYPVAVEQLRRALSHDPDSSAALSSLGAALAGLGEFQEALAALDRALKLDPNLLFALWIKGQVLRALDRMEESLAALQRAAELDAELSWVQRELGETLRVLGRYEEALAALDRALELDPGSTAALEAKIATLLEHGKDEEALEALQRAAELQPTVWALTQLGEMLRLRDRNEEALAALDRALELDPTSAFASGTRGEVLRALDRMEESLAALQRAAELDAELSWVQRELGETLRVLGRYEEALAALDRAVQLDPNLAIAWGTRGQVLRALNRPEEAVASLQRALELDHTVAWVLADLAAALAATQRLDEALAAADRALALEDSDPFTYTTKARVLAAKGQAEEALACVDQALAIDPVYTLAMTVRATTLADLERYSEAIGVLDQVLELQPTDVWTLGVKASFLCVLAEYNEALHTLEHLDEEHLDAFSADQKGEALLHLGRAEEARQAFEISLRQDPDDLGPQVGLGDAMRLIGDPAARRQYEGAVRHAEEHAMADAYSLSNVGWCKYRLRDYDKAVRIFTKALSLNLDAIDQFNLALVLLSSGQTTASLEEYERGLDIVGRKADRRLRRGLVAVALFDLEDALAEDEHLKDLPECEKIGNQLRATIESNAGVASP